MKPCIHRKMVSEDECECHSPKIISLPVISTDVCAACPFAEQPQTDFFKATQQLARQENFVFGERKPMPRNRKRKPKPCKGCTGSVSESSTPMKANKVTLKSLKPESGKTVVWVYWAKGAKSDELKYSMASVQQYLSGVSNLVICGDKPKWWKGAFIKCPRIQRREVQRKYGSGRFQKWCDSIVKLSAIIGSDLVTDDFLWMYDDTFIIKPMSFNQIARPKAQGHIPHHEKPVKHSWREVKRRTGFDLWDRGYPIWDYSTHYPCVYNKAKLIETIREFKLPAAPRLIESLYMNHHYTKPGKAWKVFQYQKRVQKGWKPRNVPVVNVGQFNKYAREAIDPIVDVSKLEVS